VKFSLPDDRRPLACIYDIVEATEKLLAAIRRTPLGEKIASEPHLHAMWDTASGSEQVLIAAIVNALELRPEQTP
jgi:hypothetical protein